MSPPRICIDGFNLSLARGSGIATYARNLNAALKGIGYQTQILYGPRAALGADNLLNEIALYDAPPAKRPLAREALARVSRIGRAALSPLGRRAVPVQPTGVVDPGPAGVAADTLWAARDLFHAANFGFAMHRRFTPVTFSPAREARAPDAVHWTCALPLRDRRAPNLYTLHDLVPLSLPWATLDNKRAHHALCARICAKADHVVTVSETSRAQIIRIFGLAEDRITNTWQAVDVPADLRERPEDEVAGEVESLFAVSWQRYFLFFGSIEPKKNLARVIEAYLASGVADPLIVVGAPGWLDERETALLQEGLVARWEMADGVMTRADKVRRYDFLPLAMLANLIRGARAVLFPSLYEGFGLPVLEAMQLGAPVIASTGGALPEVTADAAILVDPLDTQALRRAIVAIDADAGLRDELTRRGRVRAEKFSPDHYRQRLADLYRKIL